jgi:hypothetical protein
LSVLVHVKNREQSQTRDVSIFWIKALPFVKAAAYAEAIDDYCFANKRYSFEAFELDLKDPGRQLSAMAYHQAKAGRLAFNGEFVEDDKAIQKEADLKAVLSMAQKLDANREAARAEVTGCKVCAKETRLPATSEADSQKIRKDLKEAY